jgi:hypothetical protein
VLGHGFEVFWVAVAYPELAVETVPFRLPRLGLEQAAEYLGRPRGILG